MNTRNDLGRARLMELAVERTIPGLSHAELLDLERSVGAASGSAAEGEFDESFERATAAVHLALRPPIEPLPRALATKIADDADRFYAARRDAPLAAGRAAGKAREPLPRWFAWGGWAAAAASFVAVLGVLALDKATRPGAADRAQRALVGPGPIDAGAEPATAAVAVPRVVADAATVAGARRSSGADAPEIASADAAATDPVEARALLLASQPFVLRRNWAAAGDPSGRGVTGDVVWDARTQTGYMRFVGLRRNDAAREQYQLWIFDGRRDERFPVDGGVFDSSGEEEIVVPIRAKLPVGTPLAFAVTVERAGGVVVSSRERVVVIARVG